MLAATVCIGAVDRASVVATMSAPKFVVAGRWWMRRYRNVNWNIWFTPKNYTHFISSRQFSGMCNETGKRQNYCQYDGMESNQLQTNWNAFVPFVFTHFGIVDWLGGREREKQKKTWSCAMCSVWPMAAAVCCVHVQTSVKFLIGFHFPLYF